MIRIEGAWPVTSGNMEHWKGWRTVLKILIADDEDRVCRLIEKLIDWEHLDVSLVATAAKMCIRDSHGAFRGLFRCPAGDHPVLCAGL